MSNTHACSWCEDEGCRMCRPADLPVMARHIIWTAFGARHESRLTHDIARSAIRDAQKWLWLFKGKRWPRTG